MQPFAPFRLLFVDPYLPPWLPASRGTMQSVILDGVHYILNGDGSEELYDFETDVAETENLVDRPERRETLDQARRVLNTLAQREGRVSPIRF